MFSSDYYLDVTWLKKVSTSLEGFKSCGPSQRTFNCRCPVCGDSKKRKRIARCYFYTSHGSLSVSCKNCGYGRSFYNFMKEVFPNQFVEYKQEQLKSRLGAYDYNKESKQIKSEPIEPVVVKSLNHCVPMDTLDDDHVAKRYLLDRKIPVESLNRLYYAKDFKDVAAEISYAPLSNNFPSEPRIVIPFFDENKKVLMVQGRSLDPKSNMRYMTIKSGEDIEKVYGAEVIDRSKTVYVCEGPLDSLFVDNCLASCDSSLTRINADVYIWDNEPRNPEIIKLMKHAIDDGKKIVIWPWSPSHKIDMNDMIKDGIYTNTEQLMTTIHKNTFSGITAVMKFQQWKKC